MAGSIKASLGYEDGVYKINSTAPIGVIILGLALGAFTVWFAPFVLSDPKMAPIWHTAWMPWLLGVLVAIFFMGIDYQDVILIDLCRHDTRFRFYGIPLFTRSNFLAEPRVLNWVWTRRWQNKGPDSRWLTELKLRSPHHGNYAFASICSNVEEPTLEELNQRGIKLASIGGGKIFSYQPLNGVPLQPW